MNSPRLSRVSRIAQPRASFWAMLLLVVVFLGFGVWAQAHVGADTPNNPSTPTTTSLPAQFETALSSILFV